MSLLELFDSRADAAEDWVQEIVVDEFGAHQGSHRNLEPNQKEEFQCVVEGNPFHNPADVHIGHSETPVAHPVG